MSLFKNTLRLSVITFAIFISLSSQSFGQGIEFFEGTYEQALKKAKEENKIVFVDAYASWCGPCIRMAKTTFKAPKVGEYFNENFVCLKVDCEKGEGPLLARKWKIRAYPTLLFLDAEGNIVKSDIGGQSVSSLIALGKKANPS